MSLELNVNGQRHRLNANPWESLLSVIRDHLGLYAAKGACEQGECGSCSVLIDGDLVCSCLVMATQASGSEITTLEGLTHDLLTGAIQDALVAEGGVQCGFCTPGFVIAIRSLLEGDPAPSDERIAEYLSGNLCRCTGYTRIIDAVRIVRDGRRSTP
jgi:carbon-monoxide dehydrogenase small subunit